MWREYGLEPENRKTYEFIWPGVLTFLSEASHNSLGERFFGKAGRVITKYSKNLDVELKMALHANGQTLGMPGYGQAYQWVPNAEDLEFWDGPASTTEAK